MHSPQDERPDHLYQKNRRPTQDFANNEELYLRIPPNSQYWDGDEPDLTAIPYPSTSVNRQKYSSCEDVLYPPEGLEHDYCDFGIGSVTVADVPPPPDITSGDGREFTFKTFHDPLPDNYAHSEIRAFCEGRPHSNDGPRKVKTDYRMHLRKQMRLRRQPIGKTLNSSREAED